MELDDRPVTGEKNREGQKPLKRKLRVKLLVFLVCLFLSTAMWAFIELMKDYNTDIVYTISFKNVPEDLLLINQDDSTISVGVNAQGFELLVAQFMHERKVIELDLSNIRIRHDDGGYTAFIPGSGVLEQVGRQLGYAKSITHVQPDTLFFRFSEIYRKRVPVQLDVAYNLENQYQLYDSVEFNPRSIIVSSIKNVIDTIRTLRTVHFEMDNLDSNRVVTIPIHRSLRGNILRYSDDSVTLKVKVQKYTEAVFTVPVTMTGNILPIRIFPDQVEVRCLVPLNEYHNIDASSFSASVIATPNMLAANKRLQVMLTRIPFNVKSCKIKPDQVEYIIIAK
jgi:hypothetical protein